MLGVQYQINQKNFLKVFEVLEKSQSIFVKSIAKLIAHVNTEIQRAQSNVRYLKLLIEPCDELSSADSPADIPMKLPRIVNTIRFIWLNSDFFNDPDSITKLFRYVGNQIIQFCCGKINVSGIFDGDAVNQIQVANMSIDCCHYYKIIYEKISKLPENSDWVLNTGLIFNHIDSFINRIHDFIEICGGIIIFSRKTMTENHPQLTFGGDRGCEFESVCQNIDVTFENGIQKIKTVSNDILNINEKSWFKIMRKYREMTSNLEEVIDNLILNVFTRVENVEDGIYALACLHRYSTREKLNKSFERKVLTVWNLFADELSMTNDQHVGEYDDHLSYLPIVPCRILQLTVNRMRAARLRSLFDENEWIPESFDTPQILSNYKTMVTTMQKNTQKQFDEWIQSLGVDVVTKLNRLLLKRSLTHSGLFECNIDKSLFIVIREARLLKMLGFRFPVHLNHFFNRERAIRSIYDAIIEMITSYNRILMSLSETERILLRPLIQMSDKSIAPGALRLTWANEGLDAYVSDCNKSIRDLSDFVKMYQQTNAKIVSSCERLCEIVAIDIPKDKTRELHEIQQITQALLNKQMKNVTVEYENVCRLILTIGDEMDDIDSVSETFKPVWCVGYLSFI